MLVFVAYADTTVLVASMLAYSINGISIWRSYAENFFRINC